MDLRKCTHQYNEANKETIVHERSRQIVFFGCNKIDRQQEKKEAKQRIDKEGADVERERERERSF